MLVAAEVLIVSVAANSFMGLCGAKLLEILGTPYLEIEWHGQVLQLLGTLLISKDFGNRKRISSSAAPVHVFPKPDHQDMDSKIVNTDCMEIIFRYHLVSSGLMATKMT